MNVDVDAKQAAGNRLDTRRIVIYCLFAFGISWLVSLVIFLTGGLINNPSAVVLIVALYMPAPAVAHVLTRLITREGWHSLYLRPMLRRGWPYWVICWVAPGSLTIIGMAVFFLLFPQYYDPQLGNVQRLLGSRAGTINPWTIVIAQTLQAIVIAPLINGLPTFGEEFGWRAYLLPKLMPLGGRRAMVVMGIIWGVWHWPIIAMGHNYGLNYAGYPWLGLLAMVWFTFIVGTFLGWASLRAGSVWPAVIGHAAINGIAALAVLLQQGQPNSLLGPTPVGVIGSIGFTVVAFIILLRPGALRPAGQPAVKGEALPAPAR